MRSAHIACIFVCVAVEPVCYELYSSTIVCTVIPDDVHFTLRSCRQASSNYIKNIINNYGNKLKPDIQLLFDFIAIKVPKESSLDSPVNHQSSSQFLCNMKEGKT